MSAHNSAILGRLYTHVTHRAAPPCGATVRSVPQRTTIQTSFEWLFSERGSILSGLLAFTNGPAVCLLFRLSSEGVDLLSKFLQVSVRLSDALLQYHARIPTGF